MCVQGSLLVIFLVPYTLPGSWLYAKASAFTLYPKSVFLAPKSVLSLVRVRLGFLIVSCHHLSKRSLLKHHLGTLPHTCPMYKLTVLNICFYYKISWLPLIRDLLL